MQNPFETGHIKNYVLLYVSVVVIMVLFFIASTLFHDVEQIEKKTFDNNNTNFQKEKKKEQKSKDAKENGKFSLLNKNTTYLLPNGD